MANQQKVPTNQFSPAKPHKPFEELKSPLQGIEKLSQNPVSFFFSLGSKMDIKNILSIGFFSISEDIFYSKYRFFH